MKAMKMLIIIFISLLTISCTDDENPLNPSEIELPPLEDEIPYDFLGSGKILFERTGPYPGEYSGFYVIDINQRKSWSLNINYSRNPCFSNDGNKISFVHDSGSKTGYNIHTMDLFGNGIEQLTDILGLVHYPMWNSSDNLLIFWGGGVNNEFDRIFTVTPDGSNLKEIKSFYYNSSIQSFAPSGRMTISNDNKIVYAVNNGPISGLCMINLDGSNFKVLVNAPEGENLESPRLSPDDQSIAYLSITRDNNWEYESMSIRILNITTNNTEEIYKSDIGYKEWSDGSAVSSSIWICWSPDGTKLLFTKPVADFTSYIYLINIDGSQLTQVTTLEGVTDRQISWSK